MTISAPTKTASPLTTISTVAVRTILKILRTPQIVGIAIMQSIVFLLMFRYVLGGAIDVQGVDYVDFLVPG
ncbi:MAG TPA: ABC transporter permease, partial [Acidimicrobiia bacterium]